MEKTYEEWVMMYEEKTGKKFTRDEKYRLFYFPERGFCEVAVDVDVGITVIRNLCGDARFWRRVVECIAQSFGIKGCGTYCLRNIRPYIRLFGFTIVRTEERGEYLRYHGVDENGCKGTASPCGMDDETGRMIYMITWGVPDVV